MAIALGVEACGRGQKVRFWRVTELITQLMEAREERQLIRMKNQLTKLDLLILDELGYVPASKLGAELLFDVISTAYERTSLIVTTNLPFQNWTEVLGSERLTGATLDRLSGPLKKRRFLVTDNGSSFIARRFQRFIEDEYTHVRIQYRTPTQFGLLERFHKTLKVEEVYWRLYDSPAHCRECLEEFRQRYNDRRPHWALVPEEGGDPLVPAEVYRGDRAVRIRRWQGWAKGAKAKLDKMMSEAA